MKNTCSPSTKKEKETYHEHNKNYNLKKYNKKNPKGLGPKAIMEDTKSSVVAGAQNPKLEVMRFLGNMKTRGK